MIKEIGRLEVKQGFSQAKDTVQAAREFIEHVDQPEAAVVVFLHLQTLTLKSWKKSSKVNFPLPF